MKPLGDGSLHVCTFFASALGNDQCGSNGLPLTPNSIRIFGRFQYLLTINHPNLCCYIDIKRGKHEQMFVVSEGHTTTLSNIITSDKHAPVSSTEAKKFAKQILLGLNYLHTNKITHRYLCPNNIYLDSKDNVKLAGYGMYYMTESGATVSFPIGDAMYMAPEVFLQDCDVLVDDNVERRRTLSASDETALLQSISANNVDSWSFGMILLQLIGDEILWNEKPAEKIVEFLMQLLLVSDLDTSAYEQIVKEFSVEAQQRIMFDDSGLTDLIKKCLTLNPSKRPAALELLSHSSLVSVDSSIPVDIITYDPIRFTQRLRCKDLTLEQIGRERTITDEYFYLRERSFTEVYYLWKLAGGDVEVSLRKSGILKDTPPILNACGFVSEEGDSYGIPTDCSTMYSDLHVTLNLSQLCERLAEVDPEDHYPLIVSEYAHTVKQTVADSAKLPLVIREKDVEYQFHRIVLFDRLINGYPHTKTMLAKEARVDIPPIVRPFTWAALLDVQGDVHGIYDSIDKVTPHPTDRQIEVDIPRCHQYNELMSSPKAHNKLKRVLKAWVSSHPQYVYWQGLDSLSAPFVFLNFNNEAIAYACLTNFISKYLHDFFLKDNATVVQEYLAVFSQLIAFHEPELSNHLEEIGFSPDLYAIPWFLTMYAHVFPLHRLFHMWDTLLLGASNFPLCIGVAILQQLKARLLSYGFNECILLFSDLPEINIEQCVSDSVKVFCSTPKSATIRVHSPASQGQGQSISGQKSSRNSAHDKTSLGAEPLPLAELRSQRCCRISAEEMLSLLSPSSDWRQNKPKLIVIDIRSSDEYQKGTIPGSMNYPYQKSSVSDGGAVQSQIKEFLDLHRFQVKVVVDSNNVHAGKFAARLVSLGYSKVCYLYKGISVLSGSSLLVVPSPDM